MNRVLCLLCAALWLYGCDDQPPAAGQGFAGLGSHAENFAEVTPGTPLSFPADHGAHPAHRIEWWYLTANLRDEQGRDWGVQWTLFRQALRPEQASEQVTGWQSPQLWLGHAAVTREDAHRHAERLARGGIGQAGAEADPLRVWIDDWQLHSEGGPQLDALQLRASGDGFAYRLQLRSDRPLVLHGEQGFSRKSDQGQASWYYSQPFFQVSGELEWDGQTYQVNGTGWLDREWSSQPLAADQQGWDWFSLSLASGERVMLFRLRSRTAADYFSGSWIDAEGQLTALQPSQINMRPLGQTRVAGRRLPTEWQLQVPSQGLDVRVEALNPQAWMGTGIPYWEGPIRIGGSHNGMGYLEMTGY